MAAKHQVWHGDKLHLNTKIRDIYKTYNIVIHGDVNGDGDITIDLCAFKNIAQHQQPSGAFLQQQMYPRIIKY